MPKVTVIIPNYNHAKFLPQRIQSVLEQTYQDFEVILLDDNSTDNSIEILTQYKTHPKVSLLLINEKNSGNTFVQWKKGLSKAQGEYIWLAESDDYSDLSFLEKCVSILDLNKQIGLVFSNSMKVDSNQNGLGLWHSKSPWDKSHTLEPKESRHFFLRHNYIPNASSVLFKKNLISKNTFKENKYKLVGDWMLWYEFSTKTNIYFLNESLNYFRFHSENVRTKMSASDKGILEIINLKTDLFLKEENTTSERKSFIYTTIDYWLTSTVFSAKKFNFKTHLKIFKTLKQLGLNTVLIATARTYITILFKRIKKGL